MAYALQQLINGVTLGMIYGLIAVGYTMVYGIIGMINFAHGDIFMIGAFLSLIALLGLSAHRHHLRPARPGAHPRSSPPAIAALYGWTVERVAYRPLRGSFRLAPLISAIGMSIVLQNFAQVSQGARVKPIEPLIRGGLQRADRAELRGAAVLDADRRSSAPPWSCSAIFTWLVAATPLGRAMRACEQDLKMAGLLGIDTDRTISLTFVIGAALAAVAGLMFLLYYGVIDFFIGFVAGVKAFTAAVLGGIGSLPGAVLGGLRDRADRDVLVRLCQRRIQGRGRVQHPDPGADLHAHRPARPRGRREGMSAALQGRLPLRAGGARAVRADGRPADGRAASGRSTWSRGRCRWRSWSPRCSWAGSRCCCSAQPAARAVSRQPAARRGAEPVRAGS